MAETIYPFRPRIDVDADFHIIRRFLDDNGSSIAGLFNALLPHIRTAIETTADLDHNNKITLDINFGKITLK